MTLNGSNAFRRVSRDVSYVICSGTKVMRRLTSFLLSGSAAAFFRGRRHASSMLGVPFYKGQVRRTATVRVRSAHSLFLFFQSQRGTEHGPTFLRRANLFERLQKLGTMYVLYLCIYLVSTLWHVIIRTLC